MDISYLGREGTESLGYIDYPSIQPPPKCIAIKSVNVAPKQNDTGISQGNKHTWQQEANIHSQKRTIPMKNNPRRAISIKPEIKLGSTQITLNGKVHNLPTTKEYILREYADIFKGIGTLPGGPYSIRLKQNYTAVQHPPRSVPNGLQEAHKAELKRLFKEGIIAEVHEHTEWLNSIVTVVKEDGSLRLCLDPRLKQSNRM